MNITEEYNRWLQHTADNEAIHQELLAMQADQKLLEDAFYCDLAFGTAGLRGIMGAGTNRMNSYIVARASQGVANYLKQNHMQPAVVIGYDSRINSRSFAEITAEVFAGNGIKVYLWPELMPVPTVSFATRHLKAAAGIMITASHNPAQYNGYKVYGADGCQITTEAASSILAEINKLDIFADVQQEAFAAALSRKQISYIDETVYNAFLAEVKRQSVLFGEQVKQDVAIVYTPLNGTGLKPVTQILEDTGYTNIKIIPEQRMPDGHFPTCPYPNPELPEAMRLGIEYARENNAELLLATDPDCDRVGVAVRDEQGEYRILTGNQIGVLLLDYICSQHSKHNKLPEAAVMIKTVVTTAMAEQVAASYGVRTINVLTGFKYIGEQIGLLEQQGLESNYIFGFEESCGYLSGAYVRDKDGVNAAFLISEMYSYYATQGVSLLQKLEELSRKHGYSINLSRSYEFKGSTGLETMQRIMNSLRGGVQELAGKRVLSALDYAKGIDGLPAENMLQFVLEDNCSVIVRPSGTEPKLKTYIYVSAASEAQAMQLADKLIASSKALLK
ncbi:phospho-sugar mutase [uncultured Phascolarctobacterium sp.]|uniref:phospho-sugar mutase n=1 Tax=uncultured Phascolarctobacterium sp. TaxID=512296 RepID=UPI0025DBCA4C|nr:phospho-sugar mutase [uncultured Phascolarctobacterium sp.]